MDNINRQLMRHLLLRFCLGFILVWFGIQQMISPSQWTGFIPEVISSHSPVGGIGLILVHSTLLLLAAIGIFVGLFPKSACLLAAALLLGIVMGLFFRDNSGSLIVRDIGLLVMALALAFDKFPVLKLQIPQLVRSNPQELLYSYLADRVSRIFGGRVRSRWSPLGKLR